MSQDTKHYTHISEVIDTLFATSALPINLQDIEIWKVWDRAVGRKIAKHARPSSIKKGVLLVKVTDSVWMQELKFMADMIRDRVNKRLKREAIHKIRFRVGTSHTSGQRHTRGSHQDSGHGLIPEEKREMEQILTCIEDKGLRSSVRKIMIAAVKKGGIR